MGNLYDYFSASDDAAALTAFRDGPTAAGFPTLPATGIDPAVQLGTGEALLVGEPFAGGSEEPRACGLLSDPEAVDRWVVTLTDRLRDALPDASAARRAEVAEAWSESRAFGGEADPERLAAFLHALAGLAQPARDRGHRLYCWIAL